jgi:ATP-dependent helicase Lhr and Lhr-like helicase
MARAAGASVILVNGRLAAFFRRRNPALQVFLPDDEPERGRVARELAQKLALAAIRYQTKRTGLLITTINGEAPAAHFLTRYLEESGFVLTSAGLQMRRITGVISSIAPGTSSPAPELPEEELEEEDA